MKFKKELIKYLSLLIILVSSFASAQQSVSGSISDGDGPLPGVTIVEKGTDNGVSSDFDGNYTITTTNQDAVLVFSYIGFLTQEISVGDSSSMDVQLSQDVQGLEEVVVTGYGSQKKETLTGSIATIGGDDLERSASPNLGSALAGKVAGVFIDQANGAPGNDTPAVRIRGTNTFNNSGALVVIDGIPDRAGGLARINPSDIESISVLKDASAAIYGARAANGVVLITTKRGSEGKAKVKITSNYGWQNFTTTPNMLRGEEYMDLVNLLNVYKLPVNEWANANAVRGQPFTRPNGEVLNPTYPTDRIENTRAGNDPWLYPNTDWMEAVQRRNAPTSRQNVQITGGDENVKYLASAGYLRQDVNFKNAPKGFTQYDLRVNLDAKINDFLSLDIGLYSRQEENLNATSSPAGEFNNLVRQYPWFPAYWPTGEYGPDIENGNNPAIRVTDEPGYNDQRTNFVQSNIGINFKVPGVEGLLLRGNVSYDKMNFDQKVWQRPWELYTWDGENRNSSGLTAAQRGPGDPSLTQDHTTRTDLTAIFNASYEKDFGDNYFKILGGITREQTEISFMRAFKRFFLSNDLDQLSFGGNDGQFSQGTGSETARIHYYTRLNYNYKEKYLLEAVVTYDGSYTFPEATRYGVFPGVSAGWIVSEESFFNVGFLDYLKLKGSYGQLGNDNVAPFQFLASYGLSQTSLGNVASTAYETKVPNPNITWETQTSQNIGINLRALNDKLSFGFEVFNNTRVDILTLPNKTLPSYSGITPPAQNIGEFKNAGIEITAGFNGETNSGFTYNFNFNLSDSNNELVFVDEPELADRPWQRETGGELGRPLRYRMTGVFQSQADIDSESLDYSAIAPLLKPGDARVEDIDGDGKITPADKTRVGGSSFADTQFGLNTALTYKNFDFNMYWNGASGGFNTYEWSFMSGTLANVQRDVFDRAWSLDNPNNTAPRLADRGDQWYSNQTDYALITRDFIRLKTLELGYNFSDAITSRINAESIRLSVTGTNLITITDFPFDPEVAQSGIDPGNTRGATGGAVNNGGAYPLLKTIITGIQITF
jgi:TonB-linked SusC/RagA family outer membrane protein